MPEPSAIPIADELRISFCPQCYEPHAIKRLHFLAAVERRREVFCPAGHAYVPGDVNKPAFNALQSNLELTAALADARAVLLAKEQRLAALEVPGTPPHLSARELLRRARVLASRAEIRAPGRKICPICGKHKDDSRLERHLRRAHVTAMEVLDATLQL